MEKVSPKCLKKFLPIKAFDIDKEVLKTANSGKINIYGIEFAMAARRYGIDLTKYFKDKEVSIVTKGDDISETDTISSYTPIKQLRDSVIFNRSDILSELKKLNDNGNSIILCRNVFPYLNSDYQNEVVQCAKDKLKSGSIFVIGNYDSIAEKTEYKFLKNGFFRPIINSDCNFIFERI